MRRAALAAAAAVGLWVAGCGEPGGTASEARPALVLITLDTFRADHLGTAGHPTVRTPHLDRLARRAAQWTGAVTTIPLTTPSHATILTGLTPRAHGLLRNRMALRDGATTLAERLRDGGYRTGAVVSSPLVLAPELGLNQGFDDYEVIAPAVRPATGEGAETTEAARAWLARKGGAGSFLWAHYFDTHLPYLPPPPLDRLYDPDYAGPFSQAEGSAQDRLRADDADPRDVMHLAALYRSEVTFLDRCVGRLLRAPEADDAIVLVTADHGEGLWEHDRYFGHDILLYDTAIRVPLLVAGAGEPGTLSREPARTLDVMATLLGACGMESSGTEGRDLLRDAPPTGDALQLVLETHPSRAKAAPIFALRTEEKKVIRIGRERRHEYYDLRADPAERHHLGEDADPVYEVLAEDLALDLRERPVGHARTVDDDAGGMDEDTRAALRSLGYVE